MSLPIHRLSKEKDERMAYWFRRWAWRSSSARRGGVIALVCVALLVATVGVASAAPLASRAGLPRVARGGGAASRATPTGLASLPAARAWASDGAWFQRMIMLYASGNPAIQQVARTTAGQAGLSAAQLTTLAQATRATWLALMRADPASLGRPSARPNRAAQAATLLAYRRTIERIAGTHAAALLMNTSHAYTLISSRQWQATHLPHAPAASNIAFQGRYVLVYATSFSIPNTPAAQQYVALPDAYLKYADLGWASDIPAPYQSTYIINPSGPQYTVDVVAATGLGYASAQARSVPIQDVGPWNEDDNWWDPMNSTAAVAADCPLATTQLTGALTNAQVDGVCPGGQAGQDWRRVAYYLLYQHDQLPFFQSAAYMPTGSFSNGSAWPSAIPQNCPEATLASVNNDGAACGVSGYNANNGAWLRDGTYNSPVLNQSGIDLSPATDTSLGWVWPSSGFVFVNVSNLP